VLGPRLAGRNGIELRPPTLEDKRMELGWLGQPEATHFWAPRSGEWTEDNMKERFQRIAESPDSINWTIAYDGESVGSTGIFHIDWVRRDGESGLFIGRHDLYGRGIASEAVRLRTRFAWSHLRLHRVHNWIALQNRGSRRANEKAGYRQIGLYEGYAYRSGAWLHDWMGEIFPERVFTALSAPDTLTTPEEGGDESLPRDHSSEAFLPRPSGAQAPQQKGRKLHK
jgi:ribosomal-protein-alanine N-acetyltransferase